MRCTLLSFTVFCCLWRAGTTSVLMHLGPLGNHKNVQKISELTEAGQLLDENDSKRLLQFHKKIAYSMNVCCFYGNILDFYVTDILNTKEELPHLISVREDLHRVSQDLKEQGCSIMHGNDQELIKQFKEEFHKMGKHGLYKAVGELRSLVTDLTLFC